MIHKTITLTDTTPVSVPLSRVASGIQFMRASGVTSGTLTFTFGFPGSNSTFTVTGSAVDLSTVSTLVQVLNTSLAKFDSVVITPAISGSVVIDLLISGETDEKVFG